MNGFIAGACMPGACIHGACMPAAPGFGMALADAAAVPLPAVADDVVAAELGAAGAAAAK